MDAQVIGLPPCIRSSTGVEEASFIDESCISRSCRSMSCLLVHAAWI